jgi:type II restriction enzyme
MKKYISNSTKSKPVQKIINEALDILESVGIPMNTKSQRGLERMAVCFLAVAGVTRNLNKAKKLYASLKSRDIITIVNKEFEENISYGSYDDIRRKDLELLVLADLVMSTGVKRGSATNDPTRGYTLNSDFRKLLTSYKTDAWDKTLKTFNKERPNLAEILARKREIEKIPVKLPNGKPLEFSLGKHNDLQKEIIEQFLPRFGSDCVVLYIGDTSNKSLHIETEELKKLNFFELSHDELPDIVAYSKKNNWLYLIEAVHSSGPMSETRVLKLKKMLKDCKAELIFVTAFLTKADFRKWMLDIAWETEVWTADNLDHLIHFNGHKFLGPM